MHVPSQTGRPESSPPVIWSELRRGTCSQRKVSQITIIVWIVHRQQSTHFPVNRLASRRLWIIGILLCKNDVIHFIIREPDSRMDVLFRITATNISTQVSKQNMLVPIMRIIQVYIRTYRKWFSVCLLVTSSFEKIILCRIYKFQMTSRQKFFSPANSVRQTDTSHEFHPRLDIPFQISIIRIIRVILLIRRVNGCIKQRVIHFFRKHGTYAQIFPQCSILIIRTPIRI